MKSLKKLHGTPLWGLLVLAFAATLNGFIPGLVTAGIRPASAPQAEFMRFALGCLVCGCVHYFYRRLQPKNYHGLFFRGLLAGVSVSCYYLAMDHLHAGLATLFSLYTFPAAALYAKFVMKDKLRTTTVWLIFASMFGVLAVVAGTLGNGRTSLGWEGLALLGAAVSGVSIGNMAELSRSKEGYWEIFTAYCLGGLIASSLLSVGGVWSWVNPGSGDKWAYLLIAAAIPVATQNLVIYGYKFLEGETGSTAGIYQLTSIVALVVGRVAFNQTMTDFALLGAVTIVCGVVIDTALSWLKRMANKN